VDRQFNKMKNDSLGKDYILNRVVTRLHNTDKKAKSDMVLIQENTHHIEAINKLLQD